MNITALQSHVTHFSEQLKNCATFDHVVVAGKVHHVFQWDDGAVLTLDDYVGFVRVILSKHAFETYAHLLTFGSFVVIDGVISVLDRKYREPKQVSVMGYLIKSID